VPAATRVTLGALNPDGSRSATDEDIAALKSILPSAGPAPTFIERSQPIEQWARRIIERHGGRAPVEGDPPVGWMKAVGYVVPAHRDYSELYYAIEILFALRGARDLTDRDEALQHAWSGGELLMEAAMKFRWENEVLLGEKVRANKRGAGIASGVTRNKKNDRLLEDVRAYRAQHPDCHRRGLAIALLRKYGVRKQGEWSAEDRQRAIDALAKRISRLDAKHFKK
jgi:hypothetical protein